MKLYESAFFWTHLQVFNGCKQWYLYDHLLITLSEVTNDSLFDTDYINTSFEQGPTIVNMLNYFKRITGLSLERGR